MNKTKNIFAIFSTSLLLSGLIYSKASSYYKDKEEGKSDAEEFSKNIEECEVLKKRMVEVITLHNRMETEVSHSWVLAAKAEANYDCPSTYEVQYNLVCADGWDGSSCGCGGGRGCCSHHGGIGYCETVSAYKLNIKDSNCQYRKDFDLSQKNGCFNMSYGWKMDRLDEILKESDSEGWKDGWLEVMKSKGYYQ